jgi:hypothetical protein
MSKYCKWDVRSAQVTKFEYLNYLVLKQNMVHSKFIVMILVNNVL